MACGIPVPKGRTPLRQRAIAFLGETNRAKQNAIIRELRLSPSPLSISSSTPSSPVKLPYAPSSSPPPTNPHTRPWPSKESSPKSLTTLPTL